MQRHVRPTEENAATPDGTVSPPERRAPLLVPKPLLQLVTIIILGISLAFTYGFVRAMVPVDDGMRNWVGGIVGFDFIVFYSAGASTGEGNAAKLYEPSYLHEREQDILGLDPGNLPWRYPPFYLFLLAPFGLLGYLPAFWAWAVLNVSLLTAVIARSIPHWHAPIFVLLCPAVGFSTTAGQNGALSATLVGTGLLLLERHPAIAGITFGLLTYKPQLAIAIPVCLLAGSHFRTLAYMAITVATVSLISAAVFGIDSWGAFLNGLTVHSRDAFDAEHENWYRIPTILVAIKLLGGSPISALTAQIIASLTAAGALAWIWRRSHDKLPRSLALTAAIPLISPYTWDYDMAVLAVPIAYLAWDAWRNGFSYGRTMLLIALWFAVPGLWFASKAIGWQIAPLVWVLCMGYAMSLTKIKTTATPSKTPALATQ